MPRDAFERCLRALVAAAALTAFGLLPCASRAQGTRDDYVRADALPRRTRDTVFRSRVEPHWIDGGDRFWYRNDLAAGAREFILVDPAGPTRAPAFDHARLADALGRVLLQPPKANHLPFDRIAISNDGAIRFEAEGKAWRYDPETGQVEPGKPLEPASERPRNPRGRPPGGRRSTQSQESPDGTLVAFVKDHKLFLRDKATGQEHPLAVDGTDQDGYESGLFWSPDSKKLVALKTARGDNRQVHLIESSPRDQLQPRLHADSYLKPGDQPSIARPRLFDTATRKEVAIEGALFENPWSLENVRWAADSSRFTFLYNARGHQLLRVIAVDASTGAASALIEERSDTFVDYSQKLYRHDLEESGEILWASERDGWNHLYLFDAKTGQLKNQVTRGPWVVRGVDRVDDSARQVWFRAVGIRPGQDPYQVHLARVNLDGTGLVVLTEGDGTHQVEFSPSRKFLIDTYSRVDLPPVIELRSAEDGRRILELERADISALLETGWRVPERFVARGRDGTTDIHGVIYRPSNFDPRRKYPVIEQIYAGPHGAFVPKSFAPMHRAQPLAELGFVVVQIDGMGTNWRSRAFHDVCWKNLADAGLPDRILWLKAAAAHDPALDISRMGIYGGSAGGQNALGALLFHPEFYKVGVADCGCHDNRMDKIWWNEAWMGWPIGPHYAEQSNVTNAHRLRGKLLLTVGELDRNVDPASTMQVVNALIKAGKDFDLVVFPGAGHGAGGSRYGDRRRNDFFVRHLLGVEPPERNALPDATARPSADRDRNVERAGKAPDRPIDPSSPRLAGSDSSAMRETIERYATDRASLRRWFPVASSPARYERTRRFEREWLDSLGTVDFDALDPAGRVDYVLLRSHLQHALRQLDFREKAEAETGNRVFFAPTIIALEEARRRMEPVDPEEAAGVLDRLRRDVLTSHKAEAATRPQPAGAADHRARVIAYRAARSVQELRSALRNWYGFYDGYDPLFTWWVAEPYKALDRALHDFATLLREKGAGIKPGDETTIIGDPIGREALLEELAHAMIPYTPEELVEFAEKEFAWCESEMKRASAEMGLGDDWKQALERVKRLHVAPGKQPDLIRDLAVEAIKFVDDHDLVTIPQLARETWRMEMMSPGRQLVNPFFTGGEVISVSFPTNGMTHEQKQMSMRGNNVHFARATVHHEVIPGHHLQGFMAARNRSYRALFRTPFLVEGWPLYWETLLWDMKFPKSPEDRVGMLFWRMHRCARIIFSLRFHLGTMTPEECIAYLVDRVGHEKENATAEVRRSFGGDYEPLYQAAYMLGGMQLRALRRELVDSGKMTDRAFHDAVLRENAIPIELLRAALTGQELARDHASSWRFSVTVPEAR